MHHAWREPSLLISCPSCLLISTIKSKTIMSQIMLGRKARHPRNQHRVLGARLGNRTLANPMPVDKGTKVGDDLGRHQTRTSPETLVQEGSPDTVVTERNSGRTEQGQSHRSSTSETGPPFRTSEIRRLEPPVWDPADEPLRDGPCPERQSIPRD